MTDIYFLVFIIIDVLIIFLYQLADLLDIVTWKKEIPVFFAQKYSVVEYERAKKYEKTKFWLAFFENLTLFALVLFLILSGIIVQIDTLLSGTTSHPYWHSMFFFMLLIFSLWLYKLPFHYYFVFFIEEKFGFNRSTRRLFFRDEILGLLLSMLIFFLLGGAVIYLYVYQFQIFSWIAWIVVIIYSLFFSIFYSDLIVPLFYHQKPLEDNKLKNDIQFAFQSVGFNVSDIYVIDSSKRTAKANAYFTGWGKKKRIVLYDNLLKLLEPNEIIAVLFHELGHFKNRHIFISFLIFVIYSGVVLFAFQQSAFWISNVFHVKPYFHYVLFGFLVFFYPMHSLVETMILWLSRKFELASDAFVARHGYDQYLIDGLVKLSSTHLANLHPHPLKVWLTYSHPPIVQRINHIISLKPNTKE
ncbi:MAG: M48 family metallopeptidase [Bacteroidales bacterium]|nr:M48 family metallopeptidase [Bacteroidales bacterium]